MTKHILDHTATSSGASRYRRFLTIDHENRMTRNTRTLLQRPRKSSEQPRLGQFWRIEQQGLGLT